MAATIVTRTPASFTVRIEVPYSDSMLGFEEALQGRRNEAGVLATAEGRRQFDSDGSPLTIGSVKLTSEGRVEKDYRTPYGVATVAPHAYRGPRGGKTYCPLDRDARIVVSSTPTASAHQPWCRDGTCVRKPVSSRQEIIFPRRLSVSG